jgi:hypothetical protein
MKTIKTPSKAITVNKASSDTSNYDIIKRRRTLDYDDEDDEDEILDTTHHSYQQNELHTSHTKKAKSGSTPSTIATQPISLTLLERVKKLESELSILKGQFDKTNKEKKIPTHEDYPEFGAFEISSIGKLVREDMFKAIKFLDVLTIKKEGANIFRKCSDVARLSGMEDNVHCFDAVIRNARKALNIHKCHVKQKIRNASLSK